MSDLISKSEVLSLLESMMETYWDRKQILSVVRSNIEMIPSAEKRGKWIDEGWYADGLDHHAYCCSKCGEHYIKCPDEIIKFKHCPNCGAEMEAEE